MRISIRLSLMMLICSLSSCVIDKLYDQDELTGRLKVSTQWGATSTDTVPPSDGYILRLGDQFENVKWAVNTFSAPIYPGKKRLVVYSLPKGFSIKKLMAEVDRMPDGTIKPNPVQLLIGAADLEILPKQTTEVNVNMKKTGRNIFFIINVNSVEVASIDSLKSQISGIASAISLENGVVSPENTGNVKLVYQLRTLANGKTLFFAMIHILGVGAEQQILDLQLKLKDGQQIDLQKNLSASFAYFGASSDDLYLESNLDLLTGATISASLTDWVEVDEGMIDVQ